MTRRLLIVSPRFPPVNAPDHQRVRQILPHLPAWGWRPTVLTVNPGRVEAERDPLLAEVLPDDLDVVATAALDQRVTRCIGVGSLALRAYPFQRAAGMRLLASGDWDAVLFSTTEFPLLGLGPVWKRRYGVPYVVDLHDPWVLDADERARVKSPPGGAIKYGCSQWLARRLEGRVMREACHVVSVSSWFIDRLRRRYPELRSDRFSHLPFAAPLDDWRWINQRGIAQNVFDPRDGNRHWVYAGRVNAQMTAAVRIMLEGFALARSLNSPELDRVRIHFVGTSYSSNGRHENFVMPLANELGLSTVVDEVPQRIGHFQALACLRDAEALLMPGSIEPGYVASKLYAYSVTAKPILAVFHRDSAVPEMLGRIPSATVVTFAGPEHGSMAEPVDQVKELVAGRHWPGTGTASPSLDDHSERAMTGRIAEILDRCLSR